MADNFDKFTERSRKVLTLAQEEAQRLNHSYIGTEHLLLGMVAEGDGVAARVLQNMGVKQWKIRSAVEFIIGRGETMITGEIGLTPRSKRVIELAHDEARRLNHQYIGTEHLLLGLVREGEGIGAAVLESLGINLEKVRRHVIIAVTQGAYPPGAKFNSQETLQKYRKIVDNIPLFYCLLVERGQLDFLATLKAFVDQQNPELDPLSHSWDIATARGWFDERVHEFYKTAGKCLQAPTLLRMSLGLVEHHPHVKVCPRCSFMLEGMTRNLMQQDPSNSPSPIEDQPEVQPPIPRPTRPPGRRKKPTNP